MSIRSRLEVEIRRIAGQERVFIIARRAMLSADLAIRDRLVADTYSRFLDAALDAPAVKIVVTWGLADRHSWIVRQETHQSKWRTDGPPSRPLPFDAELNPEPAFERSFRRLHTHRNGRPDSPAARPPRLATRARTPRPSRLAALRGTPKVALS